MNEQLYSISFLSFLVALIIAISGLLGYIPGLRLFGSIIKNYIPMAPSTAINFIFCIAYLYGTPLLYQSKQTIPMALTTSLGFIFLTISTFISKDIANKIDSEKSLLTLISKLIK
jgi:Zn-dependent protease with chaperone function